jgi:hypothetical protein
LLPSIAHRAAPLALLLLASPAAAQGPALSGLLLGLRRDNVGWPSNQRFVTLWITVDSASARVEAQGPGILVPRRDGFWWVEVLHHREEQGGPEIDTLLFGPAAQGRPQQDTVAEAPECYASIDITLLFVGTDYVTKETHAETGCGAHPDAPTTWEVLSLPKARPFDSLFSPAAHEAFERRREVVRDSLSHVDIGECQATEPAQNWFVTRKVGTWVLSGGAWGPYVCGNPYDEFDTGIAPPRAAVGANELVPPLPAIRRTVPDVVDAISSPHHNVVVVLTASDSILVYATTRTALARRLGAVQGGGAVVMAQWVVGRFVPLWTAQVPGLLRRP